MRECVYVTSSYAEKSVLYGCFLLVVTLLQVAALQIPWYIIADYYDERGKLSFILNSLLRCRGRQL